MQISLLLLAFTVLSRLLAQQTINPKTFYTGGGCATIPNIGSPILMISNVHKYIENALNINNKYTVVKYIHFMQSSSTANLGQTTYKLAFSVTDYSSTKYLGMEVVVSSGGIGSSKINKFILTSDIEKLRVVIDRGIVDNKSFSCGDLKFAYSSYGNGDSNNNLDYLFAGNNMNGMPSSLLGQLSGPSNNKVCITANYVETNNFYGKANNATPVDLINCVPDKPSISSIRLACMNNTIYFMQLVYNNFGDNGTTTSPIVGNSNVSANYLTTIDLSGVSRIEFNRYSDSLGNNRLNLKTYSTNNGVLTNFNCGNVTTNPQQVVILANDFIGLTGIYTNGSYIQAFEVTQYRSS